MDKSTRLKTAIATAFLEQQEALYQHAHNPIHLWQMYLVARKTGLPIPAVVLEYFDHTAAAPKTHLAPGAGRSLGSGDRRALEVAAGEDGPARA